MTQARKHTQTSQRLSWEALVRALGDTPSHKVQEDVAKCGGDSCGGKMTCSSDAGCGSAQTVGHSGQGRVHSRRLMHTPV